MQFAEAVNFDNYLQSDHMKLKITFLLDKTEQFNSFQVKFLKNI